MIRGRTNGPRAHDLLIFGAKMDSPEEIYRWSSRADSPGAACTFAAPRWLDHRSRRIRIYLTRAAAHFSPAFCFSAFLPFCLSASLLFCSFRTNALITSASASLINYFPSATSRRVPSRPVARPRESHASTIADTQRRGLPAPRGIFPIFFDTLFIPNVLCFYQQLNRCVKL